ncbi:MAG: glycosyltransferase [Bacteroidetes bacterium]|nr:glycosyltransferase [Bacteroidota bacterium]
MNKIKICHIVNVITGKTDGTYTHLKMLFQLLDNKEFKQYLIFQGNARLRKEIENFGITVFEIPALNKKFSVKVFFQIYKILKNENITIIQAHHIKPYAISGIVNIFLRKKTIFNYHGIFINSIYRNNFEKLIYWSLHFLIYLFNSIEITVVPSQGSKQILDNESKLFRDIRVYYNGYDLIEKRNEIDCKLAAYLEEIKSDNFIIGIVARLEVQKRIDRMLLLAKLILRDINSIHFVILGDGPLEKEMNELANQMNLNMNVSFLGYRKDVTVYFNYFDILLLTSDWEGFPLAIWEAMYNKIAIISTDVGGIKEVLVKEKCGYVFLKSDLEYAKTLILRLLQNKRLRKQLGDNGRKAVIEKYNQKNFTLFFEKLYFELVNV